MLLMPPSLQDWIAEDHLARFIADVVETLALSAIEDAYTEERGYPPHDPRMMTSVLVYAYCTGTYSSRTIAAKLADSVAFHFLAAGNQPDFRTISEFRGAMAWPWPRCSRRCSGCVARPGSSSLGRWRSTARRSKPTPRSTRR
jgi:hypothetical protein